MGHYDDQYAESARQETERTLAEARATARRRRLPLLASSHFTPIGVCRACAREVYAIPNWGCSRHHACPHRPD